MGTLQEFKPKQIKALVGWYDKFHREFPWRLEPKPYWVWLAEIMSQQTQMATLMPFFERFIAKFPTVEALARAEEPEVLSAWTGLGYYSRARNIHKAAKAIVSLGDFPKTYEGWLELPGVGPYTAAAVASQCFGVKEPVWDGNVQRVCARLTATLNAHAPDFQIAMKAELREKLRDIDASKFNQAMMELGATVCTPRSPDCARCSIASACRAKKENAVEKYPAPKPRKETVELFCRVLVPLRKKGKAIELFVQKRPDDFWFGGMWDFPSELGGVKKPKQSQWKQSLTTSLLGRATHSITHHKITLEGWCDAKFSELSPEGHWFRIEELSGDKTPVPLATTARKILKLLLASPDVRANF